MQNIIKTAALTHSQFWSKWWVILIYDQSPFPLRLIERVKRYHKKKPNPRSGEPICRIVASENMKRPEILRHWLKYSKNNLDYMEWRSGAHQAENHVLSKTWIIDAVETWCSFWWHFFAFCLVKMVALWNAAKDLNFVYNFRWKYVYNLSTA